ncbi:MAG: hypothetical protein M1498_04525 [Candidatus Thermoplasmatota archaeon]|nr:hypothetical protein [Candidatus Thermoplasmatota archaeon]
MKFLVLAISVIIIFSALLGISFAPANGQNNHIESLNKNSAPFVKLTTSDPSVHLFDNGNGWVVFSANYSICGMSFSFVDDKSHNFCTNSVPTGTVFHLVSSPDSGYYFDRWTGSVNSTSNSLYVTVNQNINEEAIYQKIPTFPVNFTESGLAAGSAWYVNITGVGSSGPIINNSYSISLQNGTYSYSISTANKDYAPNVYSGSVTVSGTPASIPAITFTLQVYTASFTESGLSTGIWYVNLSNGMTGSADACSPITFTLQNETYSYTVSTSNKLYHPSLYADNVTVSGTTSASATFIASSYPVEFTESGIPVGAVWYINITGVGSSGPVTHDSYNFSLQNGTYSYFISTANKDYAPSSHSGGFTLNGNSSTIFTTFNTVNYTVTFNESNLPSGTKWYVNITGQPGSGAITGSSYTVSLINGSYSYTVQSQGRIYHASPGSFSVNGLITSNSVSVSFSKVKYTVTFTESNLPSGTAWYVNLSNGDKSGAITGTSYSFSLINGSYSYTIGTTDKIYHASGGSFSANGNAVQVPIAFSKVKYTVTFTETGLLSGTAWYMNLSNGQSLSSSTNTISFSASNGSYTYTIATSDKIYEPSSQSGSFPMNGSSVSSAVTFSLARYTVTFKESGLPSNATWYVNLSNGMKSGAISGTSYTFNLPNGTYSYTLGNLTGYSISSSSTSISVNGNNLSKTITFSAIKKSSSKSGISSTELFGIIGGVVAFAVIGFTLAFQKKKR